MSTNFRVRNLIADNAVYNTGDQTISGFKKFTQIIQGDIRSLWTGNANPNQVFTWDNYYQNCGPARDGVLILHQDGLGVSVEKYADWGMWVPNNSEDLPLNKYIYGRDLQINPQGAYFGGSILSVYASVSLSRRNLTNNVVDYFHGLYSEDFLVSHKDSSYTTFDPLYINNVANTVNVVNTLVDQTLGKPAAGWVSLVAVGDTVYLRFNSHNLQNTATYEYETFIKVYLKNHE